MYDNDDFVEQNHYAGTLGKKEIGIVTIMVPLLFVEVVDSLLVKVVQILIGHVVALIGEVVDSLLDKLVTNSNIDLGEMLYRKVILV